MQTRVYHTQYHKNLLHHYSLHYQGIVQILIQLMTPFTGQLNQTCSGIQLWWYWKVKPVEEKSRNRAVLNNSDTSITSHILFHVVHQQLFSVTYPSVKDALFTLLLTLLYYCKIKYHNFVFQKKKITFSVVVFIQTQQASEPSHTQTDAQLLLAIN